MNVFDLVAVLTLNKRDYDDGLKSAESSASSFGSKIKSGFGTIAKVGGALMTATTGAMIGFGKSAVTAGLDFDKAMSQVAATMGKSVDEIQELRDFAQEMGATTAFSATEAAEALNYMALAGYDAETSMMMLPNVLNLAAAGGMDLATASDMVTDAQTALGLSLEDTNVMVDQMAKISSTTNTSVSQLGDALLTVGGNAKSVSGGTAELTAVLGALADNGIKGSEAGTHLRNIILAMNPTTDAAAATWEKLNVQAYDADGNLRNLEDIFMDLDKAMEGMTEQEKTAMKSAMFNKTDLAAINALLSTSADRWDNINYAAANAAGSAEAMAETQLDNLAGDITLFKSALEGAKIAISDGLTPSLREFVSMGSEGLSKFTTALKEGGLMGAMDELGNFVGETLGKLVEKIPTLLSAGGRLLETILDTLVNTIVDNADVFFDGIGKLMSKIANRLPKLIQTITKALPKLIRSISNAIVKNAPELIKGATQCVTAIVKDMPSIIRALVEEAPNIIKSIVTGLNENIPLLVSELINTVGLLIDDIPDIVQGIIDYIPDFIDSIFNDSDGFLSSDNIQKFVDQGIKLVEKLVDKIPDMIDYLLKTGIPNIIASVLKTFGFNITDPDALGYKIYHGIKAVSEELSNVCTGIFDWFGTLMDDPAEAIKSALGGIISYAENKVVPALVDLFWGLNELWYNETFGWIEREAANAKLEAAKKELEEKGYRQMDDGSWILVGSDRWNEYQAKRSEESKELFGTRGEELKRVNELIPIIDGKGNIIGYEGTNDSNKHFYPGGWSAGSSTSLYSERSSVWEEAKLEKLIEQIHNIPEEFGKQTVNVGGTIMVKGVTNSEEFEKAYTLVTKKLQTDIRLGKD